MTDEAASANGATVASRYSRLEARRQAAEQINSMFGLNISVSFRDMMSQTAQELINAQDSPEWAEPFE